MLERQIGRYEERIAEEERLAGVAISPEKAMSHLQAALVYRTELSILRRKRVAAFGETLASIR